MPSIRKWKLNGDGSVSGAIFNSPNFDEGEVITTSAITSGNVGSNAVVKTGSGSRYFLEGDAGKGGGGLFGGFGGGSSEPSSSNDGNDAAETRRQLAEAKREEAAARKAAAQEEVCVQRTWVFCAQKLQLG